MKRQTKAFMQLGVAIVLILVLSALVYFIGDEMAQMYIFPNAEEAGDDVPMLSDWENLYIEPVMCVGGIAGAMLLIWSALTHWSFKMTGAPGESKRGFWVLFFLIVAASSVSVPLIYAYNDPDLVINASIPILFFICYAILGYWGGSILATADPLRYTPPLGRVFKP